MGDTNETTTRGIPIDMDDVQRMTELELRTHLAHPEEKWRVRLEGFLAVARLAETKAETPQDRRKAWARVTILERAITLHRSGDLAGTARLLARLKFGCLDGGGAGEGGI